MAGFWQPANAELYAQRLADVLVHVGAREGQGVRPGDKVICVVPEIAEPMHDALIRSLYQAGAIPFMEYRHWGSRAMYETATLDELEYFPEILTKGKVDEVDGLITIKPSDPPNEMKGIPTEKIQAYQRASDKSSKLFREKQNAGLYWYTLTSWVAEEVAAEVGLTPQDYFDVIIDACFLDDEDPVALWRKTLQELHQVRDLLTAMEIHALRVEGDDVGLEFEVGLKRQWQGGSGRNIPTSEVFISPDARTVNGWARFNITTHYQGSKMEGIDLNFMDGEVVAARSSYNQEGLEAILQQPGGNRLGEFALVDARHSRITRPMARTLFDENIQGNMHIALGKSYETTYAGDRSTMTPEDWESLGYNLDSPVHMDIVTTTPRRVTAILKDGSQQVIYDGNMFTII